MLTKIFTQYVTKYYCQTTNLEFGCVGHFGQTLPFAQNGNRITETLHSKEAKKNYDIGLGLSC